MENLPSRIDALSDSDLVEAAGYYLANMVGAHSADEVEEMLVRHCEELGADIMALEAIRNDLARDRDSHRKLLRFLLQWAARGSDEQRRQVEEAIEGVGQKQVVTELLLVAPLGMLATIIHLGYTKCVQKKARKFAYEELSDGGLRISIEEEIIYTSPSTALGRFFDWLKTLPVGQNREG